MTPLLLLFTLAFLVSVDLRILAPGRFAWRRPPYEYERRRLPIDILCGTDAIRRGLERGVPPRALAAAWRRDLARWTRARAPYLLYR